MVDAAAAHIVLEVEDIVQRRHQVPDVFRRSPTLLMKLHDPVQHFGRVVHLAEREPIVMGSVIINGSAVSVQLPFAPAVRKRLTEQPIENLDHRMKGVLIRFGHTWSEITLGQALQRTRNDRNCKPTPWCYWHRRSTGWSICYLPALCGGKPE